MFLKWGIEKIIKIVRIRSRTSLLWSGGLVFALVLPIMWSVFVLPRGSFTLVSPRKSIVAQQPNKSTIRTTRTIRVYAPFASTCDFRIHHGLACRNLLVRHPFLSCHFPRSCLYQSSFTAAVNPLSHSFHCHCQCQCPLVNRANAHSLYFTAYSSIQQC